jgi:hypothetical protein
MAKSPLSPPSWFVYPESEGKHSLPYPCVVVRWTALDEEDQEYGLESVAILDVVIDNDHKLQGIELPEEYKAMVSKYKEPFVHPVASVDSPEGQKLIDLCSKYSQFVEAKNQLQFQYDRLQRERATA